MRRRGAAVFLLSLASAGCAARPSTGGGDVVSEEASVTFGRPDGAPEASDLDVALGDDALNPPMDAVEPDASDDVATPPPDEAPSDAACGGSCPSGSTCGPAGYCVTASGVPAFDHVYVIVMENRSLASIQMGNAPYLQGLLRTQGLATNYRGVMHPSLPNYIALTGGNTYGVGCDCAPTGTTMCNALVCNRVLGSCSCPVEATSIADQLEAAGLGWRAFGEGMGAPCNTSDNSATHYAVRHVPFLYFNNVRNNAARCAAHVRDFAEFGATVSAGTSRYVFVAPNLCSDMHDACGGDAIQHGDQWLSMTVPVLLSTPGFRPGGRDVLFIVWDEDDSIINLTPSPMIAVSPLVRPGATTGAAYDHYSLLATIQDGLGLGRLALSASATPLRDLWR